MEVQYLTIRDDLLRRIEGHMYREGETIPSDEELARRYGVSRPTAHRAVQLLIDEGYLERRPYRGCVVAPEKIEHKYAEELRSYNAEILDNQKRPLTKVIVAHFEPANRTIAHHLEISESDKVFKLLRLRYADETPSVLVESYIPASLYPEIDKVDFTTTSLYDYFALCGMPVARAHRHLEVARATQSLATLLDMEEGAPIYIFDTVARTRSGLVVEFTHASYRGQNNTFEFDVYLAGDVTSTDKAPVLQMDMSGVRRNDDVRPVDPITR